MYGRRTPCLGGRERYRDAPTVCVTPPAGKLPAISNRYAMERIAVNLIDTALRHGGGTAALTASLSAGALCFRVADQGAGLPNEELERFFRPFEKHGPSGGAGLGLALSRLMAEQNGWTLNAHRRMPQGLVMEVRMATAAPKHN